MDFRHGGDIYEAARARGMDARNILDFSAPVNPCGVSKRVKAQIRKHLKFLPRYPDPTCRKLKAALCLHYQVDNDCIICGNGSTDLIYQIVRALRPSRVLIPSPTFSEYERACRMNRTPEIRFLPLDAEKAFTPDTDNLISMMKDVDITFFCNPNNPTAFTLNRPQMATLAEAALRLDTYLVVDEAFIDFVPGESITTLAPQNDRLIVLRSMTKFHALSGLRLGAAIASKKTLAIIEEQSEPWAVNSLAQIAGTIAAGDDAYVRETFKLLYEEKRFMERQFKKHDIFFYPSRTNYYLIRHEKARLLFNTLKDKGILLRDCSNYRGLDERYLRVAVKKHSDNSVLSKNIRAVLTGRA